MSPRRAAVLAIAAALAVGLVLRLATWTGTIATDDLTHAWAAMHVWDDPVEHDMPDGRDSAYTVNARRVGVNLPLAAGAAIAGPSETTFGTVALIESLLAVLAVALWAGALAGRRAAVLAAWFGAVCPVEVWQATIWLQDGLYAAGLAGAMAAAAWAERTAQPRWWLLSGALLGYLQYVKESAAIVVIVLLAIAAVRSLRARRLERSALWLLAGVLAVQVLATAYWWLAVGDPTYYVREWLTRQSTVEDIAVTRPFPHNVLRLGLYLGYHLALGLGLLVAAYFGVRWLRRGSAPGRVRVDAAVIAVLQLLLLLHVLRWGAWTQRYLLQLTPVVIALGAAGLAEAWPARTPRWRNAVYAALIATTALGLLIGHPQHGRWRADVVRRAHAALPALAPADTPVYVVLGPRPAHYTDRTLALLDRYRTPRFHHVADASMITRGLLVYCHLERHPGPPPTPPGRRVFAAETTGARTRQWIEIYAVGL